MREKWSSLQASPLAGQAFKVPLHQVSLAFVAMWAEFGSNALATGLAGQAKMPDLLCGK